MKAALPSEREAFSPIRRWNSVEPVQLKAVLQALMHRWGLPEALRVDNGASWGTQSSVPWALALCLVGLGVRVVYARPARSTPNAVVERSQGVLNAWVEPAACANVAGVCQASGLGSPYPTRSLPTPVHKPIRHA